MVRSFQNLVHQTDALIAGAYLSMFRERSALIAFLFHSLFLGDFEIKRNHVDPLQRTTVAEFRQLVEYYVRNGYRFISPRDILEGLTAGERCVMLTFDDGYYNNRHAIPILEEFNVPAVFYISTDNVRDNRSFWWDVLYREQTARGVTKEQMYADIVRLKTMKTEEICEELSSRFGKEAFEPRGEIDRPFTPAELRAFSQNPHVHLGNHTANHAILLNYRPGDVRDQVIRGQEALREMTGAAPLSIAYPNGGVDESIMQICREAGLKLGVTTRPEKNALPMGAGARDLMDISRFCPDSDAGPIARQCRMFRSDLLLYGAFRDGYLKLRQRKQDAIRRERENAALASAAGAADVAGNGADTLHTH